MTCWQRSWPAPAACFSWPSRFMPARSFSRCRHTQKLRGLLLPSLAIALDKPFVIGDFIIVDDVLGTVDYIGLKTTRLRSLSGEQIVFSNADLLKSRIRNYKRMFERRVVLAIGVVYQTAHATLERIPALVRAIVEQQPKTRFDRAHFKGYGDSAL